MYTCMYTYTHMSILHESNCMYICMCVYVYIYIYIYAYA